MELDIDDDPDDEEVANLFNDNNSRSRSSSREIQQSTSTRRRLPAPAPAPPPSTNEIHDEEPLQQPKRSVLTDSEDDSSTPKTKGVVALSMIIEEEFSSKYTNGPHNMIDPDMKYCDDGGKEPQEERSTHHFKNHTTSEETQSAAMMPPTEDTTSRQIMADDAQPEEEIIQPMPTTTSTSTSPPQRNQQQSELRYDNRGRVLKSSFLNSNYNGPQPGAYATPGLPPAPETPPHPATTTNTPNSSDTADTENITTTTGSNDQDDDGPTSRDAGVLEATVEEAAQPKTTKIWWCCRRHVIVMMVILLVLGLCVAIPVALLQGNHGSAEDQEMDLVVDESMHQDEIIDVTLVPNMTNATIAAILMKYDTFSTPQAEAYEWISRDPNWDTYEDWRKQQRFAIACVYYAFFLSASSNHGMSTIFSLDHNTNECSWIQRSSPCSGSGDSGKVKILRIFAGRSTLSGFLPLEIAFLSHLERIDIDKAWMGNLENSIPPIDNMPPIRELRLHDSELTGSIPSNLGLLTSLTSLDLSNNQLSSTIPTELGLLSNLTSLVLSSNKLEGSIPEEVGDLTSLTIFEIEDNPTVEAFVPAGFCLDDRMPFESMQADWCLGQTECCS